MTSATQPDAQPFRLLPAGRRASCQVAGVRVVIALDDEPPFQADAEVFEEDRWLALSTPPDLVQPPGHPVRIMTRVWEAEPERLGSVVVKAGSPLRLLAVVHDLDAEPTCRQDSVETALAAALSICTQRGVRRLKLPLLGTRYGRLAPQLAASSIRGALLGMTSGDGPVPLRHVWLVRETEPADELVAALSPAEEKAAAPVSDRTHS